jgi:hypothetical protein
MQKKRLARNLKRPRPRDKPRKKKQLLRKML